MTEKSLLSRQSPEATIGRVFHDCSDNIPWDLFMADPLGHGIGTHLSGTVATTLDDNTKQKADGPDRKYYVENEWARVIDESGIFGIVFLALRAALAIWLVIKSIGASRRSQTCDPAAFSFLAATLLITQMITYQETYGYLTWFLVGICIVANRLSPIRPG